MGPFGLFQTPVCWKKKEKSQQRHSAEKCKRGTLWDFLASFLLETIETNDGAPFGAIQKLSKKVP